MKKLIVGMAGLILLLLVISLVVAQYAFAPEPTSVEEVIPEDTAVMCTMDAMQCPDGSFVGRTGPSCAFVCPPLPLVPADVQASIDALADRIIITTPSPMATIVSPLVISGKARGGWFFEASFPVTLTNWNGLIIAEGIATANENWMTNEFVPFTATLTFISPYTTDSAEFMKRGSLIFQRDNPSDLPENDAALEFTVMFAPVPTTQE